MLEVIVDLFYMSCLYVASAYVNGCMLQDYSEVYLRDTCTYISNYSMCTF